MRAEDVKVISAGLVDPGEFGVSAGAGTRTSVEADRFKAVKGDAGEGAVAVAEIAEVRIGVEGLAAIFDVEEALRAGQIEGAQDQRVQHAEDHGVGADGHREGENGGESKAGRFTQLARGIAEVEPEALEAESRIGSGYALAGCGGVAEADEGVAAGFFRRHAGGEVVFHAQGDVRLELGIDFTLDARAAEEIANAAKDGHSETSSVAKHGAHAPDELLETFFSLAQLAAAGWGETVVFGAAVGFSERPLGTDPAALLHAVQGGIEGTLFHLEKVVRGALNVLHDAVAVQTAALGKGL